MLFNYIQDSVVVTFDHPEWESFEAFDLASKARLSPNKIKMWKNKLDEKVNLNDVERFLIQKGIEKCSTEINCITRAPVSPPRKRPVKI